MTVSGKKASAGKPLIEFTSWALLGGDSGRRAAEAAEACARHGFGFGVQIHNTAPQWQVESLAASGIPLSVHAPLLGRHIINLAAADPGPAMESLDTSARWMRKIGARMAVMHAFVMTDIPIPNFGDSSDYEQCFGRALRKELCLPGSNVNSFFYGIPEFGERLERVAARLRDIQKLYPDLTFAVENDFPCYGAGLALPEFLLGLDCPVCLDSSHLWAAANVFDRDYLSEAEKLLSGGRVVIAHFHASKCAPGLPKSRWRDGHLPLSTPNSMGLDRMLALCRKHGVTRYVFEINEAGVSDIDIFADMWARAEEAARCSAVSQ